MTNKPTTTIIVNEEQLAELRKTVGDRLNMGDEITTVELVVSTKAADGSGYRLSPGRGYVWGEMEQRDVWVPAKEGDK